jgi:hypothetical protein
MQPDGGKSIGEWLADFYAYLMRGGEANIGTVNVSQEALNAGYDPADLAGVDASAAYENACSRPGVPAEYKTAPPPPPHSAPETIVRHIQTTQVTNVQNTTNIDDRDVDNSTSFDVDGDFHVEGDFDFENKNVTASGDGAAASGDGPAAASGGVALDQSNNLDVELGFGRGLDPAGTTQPQFLTAADPLGRIVQEPGGGLFPPRPDNNISTGSGNQYNLENSSGNQVGEFGAGAQNAQGNTGPFSNQGDVADFDNVSQGPGSALGISQEDITGSFADESQHATTSGENSPIFQEEGPGDQTDNNNDEDDASVPA